MRVILLASALIALWSAGARAADPSEAIKRGVELRRRGDDEAALHLFQGAYNESPSPRLLAQIGLAEQALGHWLDAHRHLRNALEQRDDAWIVEHEDILAGAIQRVRDHLAELTVESNAPESELWVDGNREASLPTAPLYYQPGRVAVEVRATGRTSASFSVELEAGRSVHVHAALDSPPASTSSAAAATQPAPSATVSMREPSGVKPQPMLRAPSEPRTRWVPTQRAAAWMTATAGAIFLGAGFAAYLERESLAARYHSQSLCDYGDLSPEQRCGPYRTQAELFQTLAIVGSAVGAAAAVTSVLLFLSDKPARNGLQISASVTPTAGVAYLSGPLNMP